MAKLFSADNKTLLLADLKLAERYFARLKGLLGTRSLGEDQGLWIARCNSIHTFFMNYAIDCVFLDSKYQVRSIVENVRPGRVVWPQRGAKSVVEMPAFRARALNIQKGDQLHVGN